MLFNKLYGFAFAAIIVFSDCKKKSSDPVPPPPPTPQAPRPVSLTIISEKTVSSDEKVSWPVQARVLDQNGNILNNIVVKWSVSDTNILVLSASNVITTKSPGVAVINAAVDTLPAIKNQLSITVYPVTGIGHASIDDAIYRFMEKWNLPGASVGFTRNEKLVYQRGIGYANVTNSERVTASHLFRIASVSKPFTSVAIFKLVEAGQLTLDRKVFGPPGILNDVQYATIADNRVLNITVQDLLLHQAGWNLFTSGDPMFKPLEIASEMGVSSPPDPSTIIRYMLKRQLDYTPGTAVYYSNFGYIILGLVIEKITGMSFVQYVQNTILTPSGITNMKPGKNLLTDRWPDEVIYYPQPGEPLRPSIYGTGQQVPAAYGGQHIESMIANGGWIASATSLLKFLSRVDKLSVRPDILSASSLTNMTTSSPTVPNVFVKGWASNAGSYWMYGSLYGSSSTLFRRSDGTTWACVFNSWPTNQAFFTEFEQLMQNASVYLSTIPDRDLF